MNNTKGTKKKKKRQPTTVKEIVEQYLEAKGFDGLYDDDADCGCFLGDMMPCGCWCNCQGGYAFIDSEGDRRIGGKRGGR